MHWLLVLMIVRLMVPPGFCLCDPGSPLARALASLLAAAPLPIPIESAADDDHHPGCPNSYLSTGLGLQPAAVDVLPPIAAEVFAVDLFPIRTLVRVSSATREPPDPLAERLRALRC